MEKVVSKEEIEGGLWQEVDLCFTLDAASATQSAVDISVVLVVRGLFGVRFVVYMFKSGLRSFA
eukprot:50139-Rhodomonas_salina.1